MCACSWKSDICDSKRTSTDLIQSLIIITCIDSQIKKIWTVFCYKFKVIEEIQCMEYCTETFVLFFQASSQKAPTEKPAINKRKNGKEDIVRWSTYHN